MVDAAICQRMDLGPPLVSIGALNQLRAALVAGAKTAGGAREFVSSLGKENELVESTTKDIKPAVGSALGPRRNDSIRRERTTGDDPNPRRPVIGGSGRRGTQPNRRGSK